VKVRNTRPLHHARIHAVEAGKDAMVDHNKATTSHDMVIEENEITRTRDKSSLLFKNF